jgi:hypothetical protein
MGVLYALYRVTPASLKAFRADRDFEAAVSEKRGTIDIDKSWGEILALLRGGGGADQADALEGEMRTVAAGGYEVSFATSEAVQMAAGSLAVLPPATEIAAKAIASKAPREFGKPFDEEFAHYAAENLEIVVAFWKEAAAAGDAILLLAAG